MLIKGWIILFLLLNYSLFAASFRSTKILEVSSKARTALIQVGTLDKIKLQEKAIFYYQDKKGMHQKIGEAKAVKVSDNQSYWIFAKNVNKLALRKKARNQGEVVFQTRSAILSGRESYDVKKVLKAKSNERKEITTSSGAQMPEDLVLKDGSYKKSSHALKETKLPKNYDGRYEKEVPYSGGKKSIYFEEYESALSSKRPRKTRDISLKGVKEAYNYRVFSASTDAVVKKFNGETKKNIYRKAQKDSENVNFNENENLHQNAFERYREKLEKEGIDPKAIERMKREGKLWSSGMSDRELRDYLVQTGQIKENLRRKLISNESPSLNHVFFTRFTTALGNYSSEDDPNNQRVNRSFSLGYEYLLYKTSKFLEKFSLEIGYEKSNRFIDIGSLNGRFDLDAFSGVINWYPFHSPRSIRKYIFFAGAGLKRGGGNLSNPLLDNEFNFDYTSIPYNVGVKYYIQASDEKKSGFGIGYGFHVLLSGELANYAIEQEIPFEVDDSALVQNEPQFSVGFNVFF